MVFGKVVGAVAFLFPLALALWSIELALYWTGVLVVLSLVPVLRSATFLGIVAGLGVVWWEFLRAFIVAFLEPHTVFGYFGLVIALLVTGILLIYSAVFSFGMILQSEDLMDEVLSDSEEFAESTQTEEKPTTTINPYGILEVNRDATQDEIRKKYRELMQQYHPDKVQHLGSALQEVARAKTLELKQAYEMLSASSDSTSI